MKIGRRLLYNNKNGKIIMDMGEAMGDTLEPREEITDDDISVIDLEYGQYSEEFSRVKAVKVNIETKELEFELYEKQKTEQEIIEELENQLLILEGVI